MKYITSNKYSLGKKRSLGSERVFSAFLGHEAFPSSPHRPLLCSLCTLSTVFARPAGEKLGFPYRRTGRVAEGVGGGSNFSGKSTLEKIFNARVVGYFFRRLPCYIGVKIKWCKNPFISINKIMTKESRQTKPKTFVFEVALKRAVLNGSKMDLSRVFLNFSYEEELISFIRFWLY